MEAPPSLPPVEQLMAQILLTAADTARVLQVEESTIQNLHRTKQLRGIVVGRYLRFRPAEIQRFVDAAYADAAPTN